MKIWLFQQSVERSILHIYRNGRGNFTLEGIPTSYGESILHNFVKEYLVYVVHKSIQKVSVDFSLTCMPTVG